MTQPAGTGTPASLQGTPDGYATVPKLGRPLPGDLGKPILERQQQLLTQGGEVAATPARIDPIEQSTKQAAETERQQDITQAKAARQSGLIANASRRADGDQRSALQAAEAEASSDAMTDATVSQILSRNTRDQRPAGQSLADTAKNRHVIEPPASPYLLSAGSIIAASLVTGLRSDLPGTVTAQVSEPVFDSPTGSILLIPQGARLLGKYDSVVAYGQKRAFIAWLGPSNNARVEMRELPLDRVGVPDPHLVEQGKRIGDAQ